MRGARAVGSYALGFSRSAQFVEPALVNGAAGLAIVPQGRLMGALGFAFSGGRITEIDMISEPGRLLEVDLAAPGR
jgi:RNA polymerase sigma-70 factor (ECF subfamily)